MKIYTLTLFFCLWNLLLFSGTPTSYQNAYNQLQQWQQQPETYSLEQAIFEVENAFYNDSLLNQEFTSSIDTDYNFLLNRIIDDSISAYQALFEFFCDSTWSYNFDDFFGETNIESIFVYKLIEDKIGTCFSFPVYFTILARRLNVTSSLAILPTHLYAQIPLSSYGQTHTNIELGSCQTPADFQYLQEFNVSTTAIENEVYMKPLSIQEEILILLNHLFLIYENEFGYNDWILERLIEVVQLPEANNHITILMQYASCLDQIGYEMEQENVPNQQEYMKVVNAYIGVTEHIDNLGYIPETQAQYEEYMVRLSQARENELENAQIAIDTTPLNVVFALENDTLANYYNERIAQNSLASIRLEQLLWSNYRYGYQGMEKDDELSGKGNKLNFGARIDDVRLGRWLSRDKIVKPFSSPFIFGLNSPLQMVDPDGNDDYYFNYHTYVLYSKEGSVIANHSSKELVVVRTGDIDRFFHNNYSATDYVDKEDTEYNLKTTQFYPNWYDAQRSGLTRKHIPFIPFITMKDKDLASLIKISNDFPQLKEYVFDSQHYLFDQDHYDFWNEVYRKKKIFNVLQVVQDGAEITGSGLMVYNSLVSYNKAVALRQSNESVLDKLNRYLLNPEHPIGKSKATWFNKALGFTKQNVDDLARQIVFNPNTAVQTEVIEQGIKYNQVITIKGANGKIIDVNFGWIKNNDGVVRLVTGIPTK